MPLIKKSIVLNSARGPPHNEERAINSNPSLEIARGPGASPTPVVGLSSARGPLRSPPTPGSRDSRPSNPSIKPSLVSSEYPTISLGSESLDSVLAHGGTPLGTIMLIEESGSTDFASIILRGVCAQGLFHSRQKIAPTRCIVVGADSYWVNDLPGNKKEKTSSSKSKSQSPAVDIDSQTSTRTPLNNNNLKIAWRYTQSNYINDMKNKGEADQEDSRQADPRYRAEFDFTSKISPKPNTSEVVHIPPTFQPSYLTDTLKKLDTLLSQAQREGCVVRVVIPSLFNPISYGLNVFAPSNVVPFYNGLRLLSRKYASMAAIFVSCSLALVDPQAMDVLRWLETLSDTVIQLDAFPEDSPFAKPAPSSTKSGSSSEKEESAQGLLHILKVAVLSERGHMVTRHSEFSFRAGRRQFQVQPWSIPVDESEAQEETKISIEF